VGVRNKVGGREKPGGEPRVVNLSLLTYKRLDHLSELLPQLVEQATAASDDHTRVDVVIVDNDPAGSASALVGRWQEKVGDRLRYVHEPRPGIPAARNAALSAAQTADVVVFVDDDERPERDWLRQLIGAYDRFAPAAVAGPVVSVYEEPPPAWTLAGRFWDRRRLPTGTLVEVADTNNLLLDAHVLRAMGIRFDESLRMGGGSDNLLTKQIVKAGGQIVWCDEAVVYDQVAPERTQPRWLARRRFAMSANRVVVALKLSDTVWQRAYVRVRFAGAGGVEVTRGALVWGAGAVARNLSWRANGARHMIRGSGMLAGSVGHHGQQYSRPAH
jgi:succinoglycan biosynthesis protein ExoM